MNRFVRILALGMAVFLLLACNLGNAVAPAGDSATKEPVVAVTNPPIADQPTPLPAPTKDAAQPASQADGALVPCSLVTTAEVEAILAEPASPPKEMSGGCSYTNAKDSMYAFTVAAAQDKETSGILQGQTILLGFAGVPLDQTFMGKLRSLSEALDFKGFFTEIVSASKSSEAVKARLFTGGGNDLVYWAWLNAQSRKQGAFVAVRGTTMVNINVVVADTQSEESMLAASTTLANEVFKRLPAKFTVGMPASTSTKQPAAAPQQPAVVAPAAIPTATLVP